MSQQLQDLERNIFPMGRKTDGVVVEHTASDVSILNGDRKVSSLDFIPSCTVFAGTLRHPQTVR